MECLDNQLHIEIRNYETKPASYQDLMIRALIVTLTIILPPSGHADIRAACISALGGTPASTYRPEFSSQDLEQILSQDWSSLPKIETHSLINLQKLSGTSGKMNVALYRAVLNGKSVFIKIPKPYWFSPNQMSKEPQWLTVLNKIGLGTHFYGITEIDGKPAIVTEWLEGFDSKFQDLMIANSNSFRITFDMTQQMRRAAEILDGYQIDAEDLQFRFTTDGRAVITDPEFFVFSNPQKNYSVAERVKSNIQMLSHIVGVEKRWNSWINQLREAPHH